MNESFIQQAVESNDPGLASQALREIDRLLGGSLEKNDKVYLFFSRASCYGILGNFGEARRQLDFALREGFDENTRITFSFMQGLLSQQQGLYGEAFERLSETLSIYMQQLKRSELRFMYEDIQQRRAFLSVTLSKFEDAIPLLTEVLSFESARELRSNALASLGLCHFGLKNYQAAKEYFIASVAAGLTKEWEGKSHFYLGIAYFYTDMMREAEQEFLLCEKLAEDYELPIQDICQWLSTIYNRLGDTSHSESYARLRKPN